MDIFGKLFNDNDIDSLFNKIDSIVDAIPGYVDNESNQQLASDAVRQYIDAFGDQSQDDIHKIIGNITVPVQRINRYQVYDDIFRSVQLVKKVIRTYTFNILQKDLITGRTYLFKKNEDNENITDNSFNAVKSFVKEIFTFFDIEKHVRNIMVPKFLRYGDFFVHIVDLDRTLDTIPRPTNNSPTIKYSSKKDLLNEGVDILFDNLFYLEESEENVEVANSSDKKPNLNRITLEFINPHNVIILRSRYSSFPLGYIFVQEEVAGSLYNVYPSHNPTMQMASILQRISTDLRADDYNLELVIHKLSNKLIDHILKQYNIADKIPIIQDKLQGLDEKQSTKESNKFIKNIINNDDVYYLIKELLFQDKTKLKQLYQKQFRIRFIPVDRMVHFQIPSSEYFPYGESLVDPLVYPAKLYLINQLANVVIKLSRAAVIRKWIVETGPRDIHSSLLQKLKREFRNQRITADDILSFKSIPRILSDFKDLVIFSKKGQRFVDVETTAFGDPNTKIQDVEDSRRELISLSGVPAAYLGHADITDLRDQLINANISFANDVSVLQNIITDGLSELCDKISKIFFESDDELYYPSKVVKISLTPPVILMLQLIESTVASVGNIFQTLASLNGVDIDPYYLLERYIPYLDWDSFKEAGKKFSVIMSTSGNDENQ